MAFGNQIVDGGTVQTSQGYVPGVGFKAAESSKSVNTDGSSNDSAPICTHHASRTVFTQASAATTTTPFTSSSFVTGPFTELAVGVNITAKTGTTPTIQFFIDTIGADGIAYNIWASSVVNNTSPAQVIASIGSGFTTNASFGATCQLRWVLGGTATPGYTFSISIIGK